MGGVVKQRDNAADSQEASTIKKMKAFGRLSDSFPRLTDELTISELSNGINSTLRRKWLDESP